jgi:hypothetical protein
MRAIRVQDDGTTFDVELFHWVMVAAMPVRGTAVGAVCISRISASDRRKASMDSAPWFSLLR